ncbi:MAG TPA: dockerin type I domain-containing protein [Pirellulales bacterium]|jgi:hypothetical protein|nr:dockerin type I domain-containing protein [Pirellulales bacterium]
MKRISLLGFCGAAFLLAISVQRVHAQTTIADWTFESNGPVGTTTTEASFPAFSPETGAGSASAAHANALAVYTGPAGNGSSHSFSSNQWQVNDYYQFQVNTTGFSSISLTWDQASSTTGPKNWLLEYSTDPTFTTFTTFENYSVFASAVPPIGPPGAQPWTAGTNQPVFALRAGLGTAVGNLSTIYFRLVDSSTVSEGGNTPPVVATGGTDRVDNFIVTGLNPLYWDGNTSGVGGAHGSTDVWDQSSSANWSTSATGGSTVTYSTASTSPAQFDGTPGTVTVAGAGVNVQGGMIFNKDSYILSGGTITLDTSSNVLGNSVAVNNAGQTAKIYSQIDGTVGLQLSGAGTVLLDPTQNPTSHATEVFSGNLSLFSGTLSISKLSVLGTNYLNSGGGNLILSGGTLQITTPESDTFINNVTGNPSQNGGLDIPAGGTFTITGNLATDSGNPNDAPELTLFNKGTVVLNTSSGNNNFLSGVSFNDTGTLKITDGTGTLRLENSNTSVVNARNATGTATILGNISDLDIERTRTINVTSPTGALVINGNLSMGSGLSLDSIGTMTINGTVSVASDVAAQFTDAGTGLAIINGNLSAHENMQFSGTDEVDLNGLDNSGSNGSKPSASGLVFVSIGTSDAAGPVLKILNNNSLGSGTRTIEFNSGSLVNNSASVGPATTIEFPSAVTLSIGGEGSSNPAVFASGPNFTFDGSVNVFKASSATTNIPNVRFSVNNNTTFNNGWDPSTTFATGTPGTNAGVTIQGIGDLTVNGNTSFGEIYEDLPLTIQDHVTVDLNGAMKQFTSAGNAGTPWSAFSITLAGQSKLRIDPNGVLPTATALTFGSNTSGNSLNGGTLALQGHAQTLNTISLVAQSVTAATPLSTIDIGGTGGSLTFTGGATGWSTLSAPNGPYLRISNWVPNAGGATAGPAITPLIIGAGGSLTTQLAQIHFTGYTTGAQQLPSGEVIPAATSTPLLKGDVNDDGHVNSNDISSLEEALTNPTQYFADLATAGHPGFDVADLQDVGDLTSDGVVTNVDVQGLLNYLIAGHGNTAAVPEPSTLVLGLLGAVSAIGIGLKRRRAVA